MLLSFSCAASLPLRLLSQIPNHRTLILPQNPNFAPKPPIRPIASRHRLYCHSNRSEHAEGLLREMDGNPNVVEGDRMEVAIGSPSAPLRFGTVRMSLGDQAFFLLAFIACTAMKRVATSLAELANTARVEIPSTMAAIRLSGMDISDLTHQLSDLSQEISVGVSKSAQAVQAADAGIRQMGALARDSSHRIDSGKGKFAKYLFATGGCRSSQENIKRCWPRKEDIHELDLLRQ